MSQQCRPVTPQERGFDVIAGTPEEMTAHLNKEIVKWRVVFKEQGIKAE